MGSLPHSDGDDSDIVDVIIVGAGISGINFAYRLKDECPDKSFLMLEGRSQLGGTWDLFQYPGIRSDSDLHTFGYAFKEWTGADIAEAPAIIEYLCKVTDENHISQRIRYNHKVLSANYVTQERYWSITAEQNGNTLSYRSRYFALCTGYYDYHQPLNPDIPGISSFKGQVVHPQFWNLSEQDYENKCVVVIGSGATAITLLPSMADKTKSITMLQRSPSYILPLAKYDPVAKLLRSVLPKWIAAKLIRQKNIVRIYFSYHLFKTFPKFAKYALRAISKSQLPKSVPLDPHFNPSYYPWDQRLCICPDGDFYQCLREGKANIVTDHIQQVNHDSILLASGQTLAADIIVTATGLKIQFGGGIQTSVDNQPYQPSQHFVWKGLMLEGLPNALFSFGYTNASWTLGSDCSAQFFTRIIKYMDKHHKSMVIPRTNQTLQVKNGPLLDLNSTYVLKAKGDLPKAATQGPWRMRTNYYYDLYQAKYGDLGGLVFS